MARKKVTLAYITNDATRRATLKKRRRGLLKKAHELSILCNVSACAVIYSPQSEQPEAFPSADEAKRILTDLAKLPATDKSKKMVNQKTFLEQRLAKLSQQVRRLEHENKELAAAVRLRECLMGRRSAETLGKEEADELLELVDRKMKALRVRMHQLGPLVLAPAVAVVADQAAALEAMRRCDWIDVGGDQQQVVVGGGGGGGNGGEDDMLALAIFMEEMNGSSSSSSKSAWEGFLPAPYY